MSKKLEEFIDLKVSKLKDCAGLVCRIEKKYVKTKFFRRKQPFKGVLLKKCS